MLDKFKMSDCKGTDTPGDPNVVLQMKQDQDTIVNGECPYRELIGSLMYCMTATRPDIAYALGEVSKFCASPTTAHWKAVKRILQYLKKTKRYGIILGGSDEELCAYADANWATDKDTRRSTTGYICKLFGGCVSWKSQRQRTVATSTTEAEYMALYSGTQEITWLKQMLLELGIMDANPTVIFQDNQGSIALAENPVYHQRTKHIDVKYHFIRKKIEDKVIQLRYCATDEMVADIMTKNLVKIKFEMNREKMQIHLIEMAREGVGDMPLQPNDKDC
jgi:hypothetical protein